MHPARLPLALVVLISYAALHCLLYLFLTPLWQAPDEPSHVEYACLIARHGLNLAPGDQDADLQARLIRSLADHDFWARVREPTPDPLPATFAQDPFLRRAGRQVGDETPLYYLIPALICRLPLAVPLIVYLMRLVSAAFYVLTVGATWWAARGLWSTARGPVIAMTAAVAGLPMLAFLGGAVNNDSLALLMGMLAFGCLMRFIRRPDWKMATASLATAILATGAKKTAAFLVALAGLACMWWLTRSRCASRRMAGLALTAVTLLIVPACILPSRQAAGWIGRDQGRDWGSVIDAAPAGRYGMRLVDQSPDWASRLVQIVPPSQLPVVRGQVVRFSVWVRGEPAAAAVSAPVWLTVRDDAGSSLAAGVAGSDWTRIAVSRTVSTDTRDLRVTIGIGHEGAGADLGRVVVDDASLIVAQDLVDIAGAHDLLANGDFESRRSWAGATWEVIARPWLSKMRAPTPPPNLKRSLLYLVLLFPGFWGNFGWLQVPLPVPVYVLLAGICGLALLGLLPGRDDAIELSPRMAGWLALGLALAVLQVVVLPMWGRDWQPQARYLNPALAPILAFFVIGLRRWSARWRLRHALRWYLAGFLLLDAVALLGVLVPHYYLR